MSRKIQFSLAKDGGLTTKVVGATGKGCEELTKAFEDQLMGTANRSCELAPEYHMEDEQRVREGE